MDKIRLTPLAAAHWPDLASQTGVLLERAEGVVRVQWDRRDAPTWLPAASVEPVGTIAVMQWDGIDARTRISADSVEDATP